MSHDIGLLTGAFGDRRYAIINGKNLPVYKTPASVRVTVIALNIGSKTR